MAVTMSDRGEISWRCFRASCGASGGRTAVRPVSAKPARAYTGPSRLLNMDELTFLRNKYHLSNINFWRVSPTGDRFLIPVRGPGGRLRGVVARSFSGALPKALTYVHVTDEPFIGWLFPERQTQDLVVVVEDLVSAARIAQAGATGVALVGCHLGLPAAVEIADVAGTRQVVLALDADAFANSIKLSAQYHHLFWPPLLVARLQRDLKDETEEAVENFLDDHANERKSTIARNDP